MNRKRVQRLWREEGLRVPQPRRKRRRLGDSATAAGPLRAERPGQVWTFDFQFDQTVDGRAVKVCNILDEFTRESLAGVVERSIDSDAVVAALEGLVDQRGAPEYLRMDSGPEMTAHVLTDWCERSRTGTVFIDPGPAGTVAFEVELAPKSKARLDAILSLHQDWLLAGRTKRVGYVCGDDQGVRRIKAAARRAAPLMLESKALQFALLHKIKEQATELFEAARDPAVAQPRR